MDQNRRNLFGILGGAVAMGAMANAVSATELPTTPREIAKFNDVTIKSSYDGLLDHVKYMVVHSYTNMGINYPDILGFGKEKQIRLNELLINYSPHLFKSHFYVTSPANLAFDTENNFEKYCYVVTSKSFKHQLSVERFQELIISFGSEFAHSIVEKKIIKEISKEIEAEQQELDRNGYQMVHYHPIIPYRLNDDYTFQPFIAFRMRYMPILKSHIVGSFRHNDKS